MAKINMPGLDPAFGDNTILLPIRVSVLGTPIYDDITFQPGSYKLQGRDEVFYKGLFLEAVQITINQSKNIVESQVAGVDGTIKEYISNGDLTVEIQAKISEFFNVFPFDQLEIMNSIKESNESVKVTNKVLNEVFNFEDFVIKNISLSTIPGCINEVDLSISMVSDIAIKLEDFKL
ncbi:MAG: Flavobacterium phage vB FspM lotta8 [Bacteroidota bacterium]|jgi:hypothetical protein